MRNRRDIIGAVLLVCVIWIVITIILARVQERTQNPGPALLHYPGTETITEQTVPTLGLKKYWFSFKQNYPSLTVFQYYQRELATRGWQPLWTVPPVWQRSRSDETLAQDTFMAMWVSADHVYQFQLQMLSSIDITREGDKVLAEVRRPGMEVFVTQQRSVGPWLLDRPEKQSAPPFDVKGEGK